MTHPAHERWYPESEHDSVALALRLGYDHALIFDEYDDSMMKTAAMILPRSPFHRIGPVVIVRELVLDPRGHTIPTRGNRARTRRRIRLDHAWRVPRRRPA